MLLCFFKLAGWLLARTPEGVLRALAAILGDGFPVLAPGRRRLILANLSHAFPDRTPAWRRRIARQCARRLIETGMLSLATPYLDERRIRRIGRLAPSVENWARGRAGGPPTLFATLHLALWESQTWLKLLSPVPLPKFGIVFRPLDNDAADGFVRRTRERFGMRLLSRKSGFAEARDILREGGCVGLLFDQNAGMQGALTLLFERVCSSSELPGLLACHHGAELRTFYPRRTGFWRVSFESDPIAHDGTAEGATLALNRWLERALLDEDLCASWLWVHDRWRHQDVPEKRFRLESKRNLLDRDLHERALARLPRRTRIWIRMPNWLGDVVMTLPLIRALRRSRPDAEITLVAHTRFIPLLESWRVADSLQALPRRGPGYFGHFHGLRSAYPDVWLLFTNSLRGDFEAWAAGAPQRFGIVRAGKHKPFLTHAFRPPADFDEAQHHQLELWESFLRHFGLASPLDRSPLSDPAEGRDRPEPAEWPIGLIPGSENDPAKRWPIASWRAVIEALPRERFTVFGTPGDRDITRAVCEGFDPNRIENLAGRTDLPEFARRLSSCRLLITNDTGGMHLANALGVPVVALFGPTNPQRTRPVFSASVTILQPPGCPPSGGSPLSALPPESVLAVLPILTVLAK